MDPVWSIELMFTENDDMTRADAVITIGERRFHGWGRARRNPVDPDVPRIGEELAASRALTDLSHQLMHAAASEIERVTGESPSLHV